MFVGAEHDSGWWQRLLNQFNRITREDWEAIIQGMVQTFRAEIFSTDEIERSGNIIRSLVPPTPTLAVIDSLIARLEAEDSRNAGIAGLRELRRIIQDFPNIRTAPEDVVIRFWELARYYRDSIDFEELQMQLDSMLPHIAAIVADLTAQDARDASILDLRELDALIRGNPNLAIASRATINRIFDLVAKFPELLNAGDE